MKMMFNSRSVGLSVKKELYERWVVPTIKYETDTWDMRMDERHKLDVMK